MSGPRIDQYPLLSSRKHQPHNILKFQTPKPIDISTFTPPIRLSRRDPATLDPTSSLTEDIKGEDAAELSKSGIDKNLIAPGSGAPSKTNLYKKKVRQVEVIDETERIKRKTESVPWVLENDEKNVFIGNLEGGQSSMYMLFIMTDEGFKVVPADKWYRFNQKIKYKTLSIDEADQKFGKTGSKADRWMMRKFKKEEESIAPKPMGSNLRVTDNVGFNDEEDSLSKRKAKTGGDIDELDFNIEEEFQDDEEDVFEDGEEQKEGAKPKEYSRLRASDEEAEEEEEEDGKEVLGEPGKIMKKIMKKNTLKRGANGDVIGDDDSDDDRDPYADSDAEAEPELEDYLGLAATSQDSQPAIKAETSLSPASVLKKGKISKKSASKKVLVKMEQVSASSSPAQSAISEKKRLPPTSEGRDAHAAKRVKLQLSPMSSTPDSLTLTAGSSLSAAPSAASSNLITQEEVVESIRSNPGIDTKTLISMFKRKLKSDPLNKKIIGEILKKVSRSGPNGLTLKPDYQ